jgi:hypothetical protein
MSATVGGNRDLEQVFRSNQQQTLGPLEVLLRELRPSIEDLFVLHEIPVPTAERLLRETLQTLAWKWESVRNRRAWVLAILERKCTCFHNNEAERQPWDDFG